jgi:phosphoribosylformylglycinamidine cyclo-ligase
MRYADAGVDVDVEEKAAKLLYAAAKQSWANRKGKLGEVILPFDDFSGIRAIDVGALPKGTLLNIGFDGIGTKAEFAEAMGRYDSLAYDLMAMVCDDAVIRGGEPVLVGSILDVNSLGQDDTRLEFITQIAKGYAEAAAKAGVAIINGEIAQLGDRIGSNQPGQQFALSWGAAVVWFAHKDRLITGHDVRPGDAIVGFEETSLRSNGISLVRSVLAQKLGTDWHHQKLGKSLLGDLALEPSTIYSPAWWKCLGAGISSP